jgi:Spy/CpxP family protein refolding chaperone
VSRAKSLAIAMYVGAALAGAAIALAADRMLTPRNRPSSDQREWRARFFDQLKLTPVQRESATVIYDDRDRKFKVLMDQRKLVLDPLRAAQDSIVAESRQRMTQLLTPEQKAIYDQMVHAQRNRSGRSGGERR